jgi:hypothetical protein
MIDMTRSKIKLLVFLLLAALVSGCQPADAYQGRVILSGEHRIPPDSPVPGHLVVVDGVVDLPAGSRVAGSLLVLGGEIDLAGAVEGDLTIFRGTVRFHRSAFIRGDLNAGGGHLLDWEQAEVSGEVTENIGFEIPVEMLGANRSPGEKLRRAVISSLILAGAAFLGLRFVPRVFWRAGTAAVSYPVVSGSLGLLVYLVGPILVVQMIFTAVLIPAAAVGVFLGLLTVGWGLIALGLKAGSRISGKAGMSASLPVQAAAGSFLVSFVLQLLNWIPVLGGLLALGVSAAGLGGVLLTRFGTRTFVPEREQLVER